MGWIKRVPWTCRAAVLIALYCAFFVVSSASAQQAANTLSIESLGKGTAALNGAWQFHLGDDPSFSAPGLDDTAGRNGWEQITADAPWGAQGHRTYVGYAWYRKHLHVTAAPGASPDFSMLIQRIEDVYEIYWNGVPVGRNGKFPPSPAWPYAQGAQVFQLGPVRDGVLAIRVWKAPLNSFDTGLQGGFYAAPLAGSSAAIGDHKTSLDYRWLHSRQYYFGLNSLYALIAILSLLMWLRDRSQPVLLWMALFTSAQIFALVLTGLRLPWAANFALGWLQPVLSVADISLWYLLLHLLRLSESSRLMRFTRYLAIVSLSATSLDGLLTMVDWSNPAFTTTAQVSDALLTVIFTLAETYPVVLVCFALRKRLDLARWLVAGSAFFFGMLQVVRIALAQGSRFTHWTVSGKLSTPLFSINGNSFTLTTLSGTALLLAIIYAVYRYTREELERQQAVQQELRSAQELQQVLIPEELPPLPGFVLTSSYCPAQEVGGDFFQIIPLEDNAAIIVIGDVSGKGLRAAMAVSLIVGAVRTLVEVSDSPAAILAGLNRRLHGRLHGGFATCLVLRLSADGSCTIANAAHPSPFLNGQEMEFAGSIPLGIDAATEYTETTARVRPADYLVLYTDGLSEARTADGELFSFNRVSELLAARPDAARATEAAMRFGQQDDITVLTLTRLAVGEEARTEVLSPALVPA